MKSLPKIITTFFLTIFIFQLFCILFLTLMPNVSQAATATFKPEISIGTDIQAGTSYTPDGSTSMIATYIRAIYKYAIGIVGILAAVVLMVGGVMWIAAAGNPTTIGEAKSWIGASLIGLVLALTSYLILATVNPDLVDLKTTAITPVADGNKGSCIIPNLNPAKESTCEDGLTQDECSAKGSVTWTSRGVCPTPCCLWDINLAASAISQAQCRLLYPLSNCLFTSNSYNNCDDTNKNLTETECSAKGPTSITKYISNGTCIKQTLIGTTDTLTSYQCQAK